MRRLHVIRAPASTPDDKVTGGCQGSLQTGLSSPRQEAGSSGGAALSHLPAASVSDGEHSPTPDGCFDFSLCDASVACHIMLSPSCEPSTPGQQRFSSFCPCLRTGLAFTNRAAWSTSWERSGGLMKHRCSWCHKQTTVCGMWKYVA